MMIRKWIFILMMAILAAGGTTAGRAQAQPLNAVSNSALAPPSAGLEADEPETKPSAGVTAAKGIKTTLDTLDVQEMDIKEVLKRIAFQSGLEIISDEDIGARVTIYLTNVDVFDALRIILDTNGLAYSQDVSPAPPPAGPAAASAGAPVPSGAVHVMTARSFESRFGYPFSQKIQTRVIPLVNAPAERVGALLNKMKSDAGKVIYSDGTKSFILLDAPEQLKSMSELIREIDVPVESKMFDLRHVKARDMAPRIQEFLTRNVGRIEFGERETALTIDDTPARLVEIGKRIEELDKPAREVFLEVKILQIILNDENRQGVDWEAIVSGYQSFPFTGFEGKGTGILGVGTVSEEDYAVLLDALDTVGMLNTVSNLKMTAGDAGRNEILIRARDLLADFEPQEPQEGLSGKTEVLYGVGSQLGDDGQIMLEIQPQVLGESAGEKKGLTLKLQEGTTVVVGGLFKSVHVAATRKIPLLGDLPLLGFAFRMQGQRLRETEIIVFLTPKVIVKKVEGSNVEVNLYNASSSGTIVTTQILPGTGTQPANQPAPPRGRQPTQHQHDRHAMQHTKVNPGFRKHERRAHTHQRRTARNLEPAPPELPRVLPALQGNGLPHTRTQQKQAQDAGALHQPNRRMVKVGLNKAKLVEVKTKMECGHPQNRRAPQCVEQIQAPTGFWCVSHGGIVAHGTVLGPTPACGSTVCCDDLLVDTAGCPPDGPQHQWHQGAGGHLGVHRHTGRLQCFASVQQQTHHIVRNGRNRQALHRGLQPQLHLLPAGQLLQQLLVLPFGGDVHPRAQQCAGARHPL